jgi:O-antigen/teichoic acid export membrane protein
MSDIDLEVHQDVLDTGKAGGMAIRGGALRTFGHVAAMLLSLASVPFLIRHLGEVDYGYYTIVVSITFIIGGITEAGLTNLGTRRYSVLDGEERTEFLRSLVGLRLALTVAGVGLSCLFAAATGQPGVVVAGTALAGAGLLLGLTQQTYAVSLSSQLRLGWVTGLELLKQLTITSTTVALVLVGASLLPFFLAIVAGGAVILAATLLLLRGEGSLTPRYDLRTWRAMMSEVLPYALAAAVGLVYFRLALILMSYVASDRETGIYSAAYRVVETVGVIPWLLVSAGFPILARAARDDSARLRYALQRLFDVGVLLGAAISLAVAIGAPFAIDVIAGDDFEQSVGVLRILAGATVMSFLVATWSFALLSLEQYRKILVANAGAVVTAAVLTLALVPGMGAEGAAIATLGAETALALGYLVALRLADPALVPSVSTILRLLPGSAAAIVVAIVVPAHPVVLVALGSAVYFALAGVLRAIPPELVNALLRRDPEGA